MKNQKNILLVEDDLNLGFLLVELLESEHYFVKLCKDGRMGLHAIQRQRFDLCILDVMMPNLDGFTLAQSVKELHTDLPFLFLTAKSRKTDKMKGYACGAEDYITKPFDEDELLWKIKVILRRQRSFPTATEEIPDTFQIGVYQFNYALQQLKYKDEIKRVTKKENEILRLFCMHKNQILKREDAVELVYGRRDYFLGRSFDVFISRIRKLLKEDPTVQIENVFNVGFILKVEEPEA